MGLITKTSYDFLYDYLKLHCKSICQTQLGAFGGKLNGF